MNRKILLISVVVFAVLLVGTTFMVVVSAKGYSAPQMIYPKGIICGNAQLGAWSTKEFIGKSNFQGLYSLFRAITWF